MQKLGCGAVQTARYSRSHKAAGGPNNLLYLSVHDLHELKKLLKFLCLCLLDQFNLLEKGTGSVFARATVDEEYRSYTLLLYWL